MTDKDLFRAVALSTGMGERFEIENEPLVESKTPYGLIRSKANELIDSAKHFLPKLPNIYFDFVFNGRPNAFATKQNGEYFIGVTTGTVFFSSFLFSRILSHRETFPDIGRPQSHSQSCPKFLGRPLMRRNCIRKCIKRGYSPSVRWTV
jgi:hypothetical protein